MSLYGVEAEGKRTIFGILTTHQGVQQTGTTSLDFIQGHIGPIVESQGTLSIPSGSTEEFAIPIDIKHQLPDATYEIQYNVTKYIPLSNDNKVLARINEETDELYSQQWQRNGSNENGDTNVAQWIFLNFDTFGSNDPYVGSGSFKLWPGIPDSANPDVTTWLATQSIRGDGDNFSSTGGGSYFKELDEVDTSENTHLMQQIVLYMNDGDHDGFDIDYTIYRMY